jgi:hypothetical protein
MNTNNDTQDAKNLNVAEHTPREITQNSLWARNLKPKEEIEIWLQLKVDFSWKHAPDGNYEQALRNDLEQEVRAFLQNVYLPQMKKRADSRLIEAIEWRKG